MKNSMFHICGLDTPITPLSSQRTCVLWPKKLVYPLAAVMLLSLAQSVSAQNWTWTGAAGDGLWGTPGNWDQGTVPPAGDPSTSVNAFLTGGSVITIAAGTVENPGTGNDSTMGSYGSIFGPEFGGRLNIYGTLNYHWVVADVDNNANRAIGTQLNLYDESVLRGVNLCVGVTWWYQGGPYATMNMYSNSQAFVESLWLGGHVNVYDNSLLWLTNGVVEQGGGSVSDATRSFNLGGGQLVMPGGSGGTVMGWISRGIFLAHGKRFATNDVVINEQGTNTFVSALALGGDLQRIYFLPESSLMAGMYRQAMLVGDYPGVSGVVLSTADPGVDLATLPGTVVYQSSNTNVATVTTNGLLHAINPGTATVTASVGTLSSTNALAVVVTPAGGTLVHRYSFNESAGSLTTADSVGGSEWDGTLYGTATLSAGQLVLDGLGYVLLPSGSVSNLDAITIEAWATFGASLNPGAALYALGNQNGSGVAFNYISMIPRTYATNSQANFGIGDLTANLQAATATGQPLDGRANVQVVAVYYPLGGTITLFTNGLLSATYNNVSVPLSYEAVYGVSPLSYVLADVPIGVIGASLYNTNGYLSGSIDELRIYDGPLTPSQISADYALGPNQLIGSNSSVTLDATSVGGNLVLSWPTNSALVTLTSTSNAGSPGSWAPVSSPLMIAAGEFQVTVSPTNSARYFRLEK